MLRTRKGIPRKRICRYSAPRRTASRSPPLLATCNNGRATNKPVTSKTSDSKKPDEIAWRVTKLMRAGSRAPLAWATRLMAPAATDNTITTTSIRMTLLMPTAAMAMGPKRPTMNTSTTLTKLCSKLVMRTGKASRQTCLRSLILLGRHHGNWASSRRSRMRPQILKKRAMPIRAITNKKVSCKPAT